MRIAVLKERRPHETRVAATPDSVRALKKLGAEISVAVEKDAGAAAGFSNEAYEKAGAVLAADAAGAVKDAGLILKVQRPLLEVEGHDELAGVRPGAKLVALLSPHNAKNSLFAYAQKKVDAFALELIPRITRAQAMDVLSSQSNLAGYRAVIEAAHVFNRAFPMMMTAAGTVAPARVMVMGAGVAGLQAIATAKRLGAIVSATDVRMAAREQVQSLGANFVMVEDEESRQAETSGGYAREMSEAYKQKQAALIAETIRKQDVVICTALVPGRPAPRLVTDAMLASMKPGSVVVDLAVEAGGNCEGVEAGKIVLRHGVKVVGIHNLPSRVPADSSSLFARNIVNFLGLVVGQDGNLCIDWEDEIMKSVTLTRDGQVVHSQFRAS